MANMIQISTSARQNGFGTHPHKTVTHLTPAEREFARSGGVVVFRSRLSGGNHGTAWRMAVPNRKRFMPRVPPPAVIAALDAPDLITDICREAGFIFA